MVDVRSAGRDDHVDIMRIFDGALLETDLDRISSQLAGERGCILIAESEGRPVGAIGLWTDAVDDRPAEWVGVVHITAIAVSNSRRGQGIGRALIAAAAEWADRGLSATFDERVRDFYVACDFEIIERVDQLWGLRSTQTAE